MKSPRRRPALALTAIWLFVAGAIAVGLVVWTEIAGQAAVREALRSLRPWLLLWRVCLLASLLIFWHGVVSWISRYFGLSPSSESALRSWRWRAGTGIVLMDLVLVEDVLGLSRAV